MLELPVSGLIPVFPLIGALLWGLCAFFKCGRPGSFSRKIVSIGAPGLVLLSFLLALAYLTQLLSMPEEGRAVHQTYFPWISIALFRTSIAFVLDPLSIMLVLVITGVGFLIHVYSIGYMGEDESYPRYFAWLNLFTAMMLVLVMGDNLLLMFIGWEGVGLCSYLLIGFWFKDLANARAGMKAFIVNRVGDAAFIAAMFLMFWTLGDAGQPYSFSFHDINAAAGALSGRTIFGAPAVELIALLLFIGAAGKSAQIPLYVWLPDAMAGPTPVSALIHAATMVTAGVYMIGRLSGLFILAHHAMFVVAAVGVITAFFAALIAMTQHDIKKVLAYSTISQLGYMFLGMGVGAFSSGIFHLITHAFFKALLFLGAGSVILGMHHEQDMRRMGGLRRHMPVTAATYLVGVLAISGVFPFAGFFSKDEILFHTLLAGRENPGYLYLFGIGMVTAVLTAFYMFRSYFLVFTGPAAADAHHHESLAHTSDASTHGHDVHGHDDSGHGDTHVHGTAHESPRVILFPLVVLATLAVVAGLLNLPAFLNGSAWLHHWLAPVFEHGAAHGEVINPAEEGGAALTGLGGALLGIFVSWFVYVQRRGFATRLVAIIPWVHGVVYNKFYVDELYDRLFVRSLLWVSRAVHWFDANILDGAVNGVAARLVDLSVFTGWADNNIVDGSIDRMAKGVLWFGSRVRGIQTGYLYHYVMYSVAGAAAIALIMISVN